jgi:hypothetical protein
MAQALLAVQQLVQWQTHARLHGKYTLWPRERSLLCARVGIMHLFGHVTDAQADSGYTAYFPLGVFLITLGFYIFVFIQRVLGPLLAPSSQAGGGSCCAAAVPASFGKVRSLRAFSGTTSECRHACAPGPSHASCVHGINSKILHSRQRAFLKCRMA